MAETWVLNEQLDPVLQLSKKTISFTSNGQTYAAISFQDRKLVYYTNPYSSSGTSAYTYTPWDAQGHWTDSAYRTIVFDTSPSGSLLTWLQENGTKQSEPEPPEPTTPKHACLIDGTVYSIKSGKTLISGTGYGIENGKTLIDGVGYNISFSKKLSVDMQGTFTYTTVSIDGVSYTSAGVVEAEPNTRVTVTVSGSPAAITNSAIYYNGSKVATGQKRGNKIIPATYSFTLKSDTIIRGTDYGGGRTGYAIATITT